MLFIVLSCLFQCGVTHPSRKQDKNSATQWGIAAERLMSEATSHTISKRLVREVAVHTVTKRLMREAASHTVSKRLVCEAAVYAISKRLVCEAALGDEPMVQQTSS